LDTVTFWFAGKLGTATLPVTSVGAWPGGPPGGADCALPLATRVMPRAAMPMVLFTVVFMMTLSFGKGLAGVLT
jgi:hypothetical protein